MKIKIHLLGIALLVLIMAHALSTPNEVQSGQPERTPAVVIVGYTQSYGPIVNGFRPVTGLEISWSNSSSNAPTISPGSPLATTLASLMSQEFEISFYATTYILLVRDGK